MSAGRAIPVVLVVRSSSGLGGAMAGLLARDSRLAIQPKDINNSQETK